MSALKFQRICTVPRTITRLSAPPRL